MTCIVGLVDGPNVLLGADSVGVDGWMGATARADEKAFRVGEFVLGFTTSFRMGQILRYRFDPPKIDTWDVWRYMATTFVDAAREAMKAGGFLTTNNGVDEGGAFLVGVRGQLFKVESDFQIGVSTHGYDACGCGAGYALGAMATNAQLPPRDRILSALGAAATHSAGVRGPFLLLGTDIPTAPVQTP